MMLISRVITKKVDLIITRWQLQLGYRAPKCFNKKYTELAKSHHNHQLTQLTLYHLVVSWWLRLTWGIHQHRQSIILVKLVQSQWMTKSLCPPLLKCSRNRAKLTLLRRLKQQLQQGMPTICRKIMF